MQKDSLYVSKHTLKLILENKSYWTNHENHWIIYHQNLQKERTRIVLKEL